MNSATALVPLLRASAAFARESRSSIGPRAAIHSETVILRSAYTAASSSSCSAASSTSC